MKIEFWIIAITGFLVWNAYHEGKYVKLILDHKKYFQMGMIAFAGLAFLLFFKKYPSDSNSMILSLSSLVKYLPIDKHTSKVISPMIDLTTSGITRDYGVKSFREEMSNMSYQQRHNLLQSGYRGGMPQKMGRVVNSGVQVQQRVSGTNKRSVSEAKKKYVASKQAWRCGHCGTLLDATYEVDHKVALMHGGTNEVDNLEALCPNCHRKKTTKERLGIHSSI